MPRLRTKIGDVFAVKINNGKNFFQYIISDLTQLNSDVIRVFKELYPIEANPDLSDIVKGEVVFYAHCVTKWGIELGYWDKIGNINDVGVISHILFRDTGDYGKQPPIKISQDWWIGKLTRNKNG